MHTPQRRSREELALSSIPAPHVLKQEQLQLAGASFCDLSIYGLLCGHSSYKQKCGRMRYSLSFFYPIPPSFISPLSPLPSHPNCTWTPRPAPRRMKCQVLRASKVEPAWKVTIPASMTSAAGHRIGASGLPKALGRASNTPLAPLGALVVSISQGCQGFEWFEHCQGDECMIAPPWMRDFTKSTNTLELENNTASSIGRAVNIGCFSERSSLVFYSPQDNL